MDVYINSILEKDVSLYFNDVSFYFRDDFEIKCKIFFKKLARITYHYERNLTPSFVRSGYVALSEMNNNPNNRTITIFYYNDFELRQLKKILLYKK